MITLRLARPTDSAFCYELRMDPAVRHSSKTRQRFTKAQHTAWFTKALKNQNLRMYIIESHGKTVGTVRIERTLGDKAILSYALLPAYRGMSIGATAVERVVTEECTRLGFKAVRAWVREDNQASRRLLERLGFVAASDRLLLMEKEL